MQRLPWILLPICSFSMAAAQLLPPPEPAENPTTEAKRLLGKVLFWDEQLSSDGTVSCGTCHIPGNGGTDPRQGVHPGPDEAFGTPDDIIGSPGVVRVDPAGRPVDDPLFGTDVQVTARSANTALVAAWASDVFWDGRASTTFVDPETGATSVAAGGGLESQAIGPILSDVEMAHEGRTWDDVRYRLEHVLPLAGATNLPPDLGTALESNPSYPDLFQSAFGDPAIGAERIAFAIAAYERTLVPDQTPWDRFMAGETDALTADQQAGLAVFSERNCVVCHAPPEFTDHSFRNIGIRPPGEDPGRQDVTGLFEDRGKFKVPTLRNVGLKETFMHNGRISGVGGAVRWYRAGNPDRFVDNLDPLVPVPLGGAANRQLLVDFLENGLTDPRVAAEEFPFDRPTLHGGALQRLDFTGPNTLTWPALEGVSLYRIYRGDLAGLTDGNGDGRPDGGYGACVSILDPDPTDTTFLDTVNVGAGDGYFYLKAVVDEQGAERGLGGTSSGLARVPGAPCP